jgi:hypothetical protein
MSEVGIILTRGAGVSGAASEGEKGTLTGELQRALTGIRRFSGFLPICASCKKIRDEVGRWWAAEEYAVDQSEAEFSHGLCPDCAVRLYPQYFRRD